MQKANERKKIKVRFSLKLKFSLAMILLTVGIIVIMSGYFIYDESKILKDNIINMAENEIELLTYTAIEALSSDDILPLSSFIKEMTNLKTIKYAHVIDMNEIVQASTIINMVGKKLSDKYTKEASNNKINKIYKIEYVDPDNKDNMIYDFSKPVYHKIYKERRLATVRLGFSNKRIIKQIKNVTSIIVTIASAFIIISIISAFFLAWFTTKHLKKLSQGAALIGKGNLDHKIKVKTHDEIGRLAQEFNIMTRELKTAKDKEIENRIMEEQLEVAKEIQEGLNPMGFYNKSGIQIKGFTRAAKGVGGDYFDFAEIDENRIGALISDVSGKGIPASLVMVMIRTVFVSTVHQVREKIQCAKVVSAINDSLSADFAIDKFATLFFMIYNRKKELLTFANAGHGPLFCYRSDKHACSLTKVDGMPIGVMEEIEYKQTDVAFHSGDIIVLYTDGITEMRNPQKEEYGRFRLQKLIIDNNKKDANELVETIVEDVETFRNGANPHDDMTVLIMKRVE